MNSNKYRNIWIFITVITCPTLVGPTNGTVVQNGTAAGSTATYYCNDGFTLADESSSEPRRVCSSNGTWTGTEPTCSRKSINSTNAVNPVVVH